jgi:hypothetical protein
LSRASATLNWLALVALLAALLVLAFPSPASAHGDPDRAAPISGLYAARMAACTGPAAELPEAEWCRAGCCGLACCPSLILPPSSFRELLWRPLHAPLAGERLRASLVPEISPPPPKRPS